VAKNRRSTDKTQCENIGEVAIRVEWQLAKVNGWRALKKVLCSVGLVMSSGGTGGSTYIQKKRDKGGGGKGNGSQGMDRYSTMLRQQ